MTNWNDVTKKVADLVEENQKLRKENAGLKKDHDRWAKLLQTELNGLKDGTCPDGVCGCYQPKKVSKPKAPKDKKVGTVMKRKDGRNFTRMAKVAKARKIQGQYLGRLRSVTDKKRKAAIQKVARTKGVPAALAMLKG